MADNKSYIEVPDKLKHGFIYHVCGLVLVTLDDKRADDMFNLAKVNLGIVDNAQ